MDLTGWLEYFTEGLAAQIREGATNRLYYRLATRDEG